MHTHTRQNLDLKKSFSFKPHLQLTTKVNSINMNSLLVSALLSLSRELLQNVTLSCGQHRKIPLSLTHTHKNSSSHNIFFKKINFHRALKREKNAKMKKLGIFQV